MTRKTTQARKIIDKYKDIYIICYVSGSRRQCIVSKIEKCIVSKVKNSSGKQAVGRRCTNASHGNVRLPFQDSRTNLQLSHDEMDTMNRIKISRGSITSCCEWRSYQPSIVNYRRPELLFHGVRFIIPVNCLPQRDHKPQAAVPNTPMAL